MINYELLRLFGMKNWLPLMNLKLEGAKIKLKSSMIKIVFLLEQRLMELMIALQFKSQDILNVMDIVVNTKILIRRFRENGLDQLFEKVNKLCEEHEIDIADMTSTLKSSRGRLRTGEHVTYDHHYRFDVFTDTIDVMLQEMDTRFDENAVELLRLSSGLDPRHGYKSFNIGDICKLVEKFYPADFTDHEKLHIKYQLELYLLDIQISTATTERAFSSMKLLKTRLRNKMEDDFLASSLLIYIEKDIAETFDVNSIIDEFEVMKKRRVQLTMPKIK
ncbi:hypothetical protein C2S53_020002 [Perilla frutescens var. hirtella]|uniref:HAT C-terminal dimerisation domain-containing protein n=1 Tax=Perilla frutescens var. hirtella TaxID=608512 RepID=A0AAD4ITW2_PERFH|nr:hypothetical protein C2S53_020002 [Perilla frutescens var. hirtella]